MSVQDLVGRIETARNNLQGTKTQLSTSRAINPTDITSRHNPGVPTKPCPVEPRPGRTETVLEGAVDGARDGALAGAGIGTAIGLAPLLTGPGAAVTPVTVAKGIVGGIVIGGAVGAVGGAVEGYLEYEIDSIPDEGCPTLPPTL